MPRADSRNAAGASLPGTLSRGAQRGKMNPVGWQVARMLHGFRASPRRGIFARPRGFRMTDRRFYLLLTLLVLTLAAGEVVYAMVGPLSAPTHQIDDLSSINRVR